MLNSNNYTAGCCCHTVYGDNCATQELHDMTVYEHATRRKAPATLLATVLATALQDNNGSVIITPFRTEAGDANSLDLVVESA